MALFDDIPTEILHVVDADKEHVHVEDDNFWQSLLQGRPRLTQRRCARFVGLFLVAFVATMTVLVSAINYVQNVLLYQNDMYINEFGSFVHRSCNNEYVMFLFDTSEPWATSGIQVQEGDRVFVSASGSFHTNIYELINAADSNRWADVREQHAVQTDSVVRAELPQKLFRFVNMCKLPHSPSLDNADFLALDTMSRKVKTPLNHMHQALFGDVLMQVSPEYKQRDSGYVNPDGVYAIPRGNLDARELIRIPQDGMLSFCVNDSMPYNNLGQVLVAMQIYRARTWHHALRGHIFDFSYFWYDYLNNMGYPFLALMLLLTMGVLAIIVLCAVVYALPFLFIHDTWRRMSVVCRRLLLLPLLCCPLGLWAQAPQPYFTSAEMPNAVHYLPRPAAQDEPRFVYDSVQYQWGKSLRDTPRGEKARRDADYGVVRMAEIFSPVLGLTISPSHTPALWRLLTDATKTADFACDSAKITYMRARPYMVYGEPTLMPRDEDELRKNGSYPSGHTTLGWVTALILCEINPMVQDELLREGFEYGQSRVIAGFHWQSDVDAARVVAGAAFARLHTSRTYLRQLQRAQREYKRLTRH